MIKIVKRLFHRLTEKEEDRLVRVANAVNQLNTYFSSNQIKKITNVEIEDDAIYIWYDFLYGYHWPVNPKILKTKGGACVEESGVITILPM